MSKLFGFLLGIAVALALVAGFGVLAAEGGVELSAREMALAYGVGALVFWAVTSYFSGAAALGAALTFGAMIYTVHWIPNRMTNFLEDVPGVTTGMIEGIRDHTLNGLVPVLAVISLVYAVQLMVRAARHRRRLRAEAALRQREQELTQRHEAEDQYQAAPPYPTTPAAYPTAPSYAHGGGGVGGGGGGEFPTSVDNRYDETYRADEERHGRSSDYEQTAQYPVVGATGSGSNDETTQLPTQRADHHSAHPYDADGATADYSTQPSPSSGSSRSDEHEPPDSDGPSPTPGGGQPHDGGNGPSRSRGTGSSQFDAGSPPPGSTGASRFDPDARQPRDAGSSQPDERSPEPKGGAGQYPTGEGIPGQHHGRHLGPQASAQLPTDHGRTAGFAQSGHFVEEQAQQPEQHGQQYRERMDNPDHHFSVEPEHHPQAFLPNQFRIA